MKYNAPYGASDQDAPFVNGNPLTGTAGSVPPAQSIEHPQREIVNAIIAAGLTPDANDLTQLSKAIIALVGSGRPFATPAEVLAAALTNKVISPATLAPAVQGGKWRYAVSGGTANALTVTLNPVPTEAPQYIKVRFSATNTASGPSIKVNGLTALPTIYSDGTPVLIGEFIAGNEGWFVRHDDAGGNAIAWVLLNPVLFFARMTPSAAKSATAFTSQVVVDDLFNPNQSYQVQSVTVTGASYMQINAVGALKLDLAVGTITAVGCTMNLKVTRVNDGANIPVTGSPYIGCVLVPSVQIPLTTFSVMQGLDPTKTYKIDLMAVKNQPIGPVMVLDTFINVLYG